jgi:hypothetical protein
VPAPDEDVLDESDEDEVDELSLLADDVVLPLDDFEASRLSLR